MTKMLASVNSLEEALLVQDYNVDIIDLKQPAEGALGRLPYQEVAEIVDNLSLQSQISATIGDLPMQPDLIYAATLEMATTGVDYIKIGFFPGGDWQGCISILADVVRKGYGLIAVLFADAKPDFAIIEDLAKVGFRGVMLDTMNKQHGSLRQFLNMDELALFVNEAKQYELLTGLAGSLTANDISELLSLNADYLGFRGALCKQGDRIMALDDRQIKEIRGLIVSLPDN